jgi:hypothetical protein
VSGSEEFVEWMMLEAKASREGLPVHPEVEPFALFLDEHFRKIAAEFVRFAEEHKDEIERWAEEAE